MHEQVLMSIGDFARASGLTAKALRLYDTNGLLAPAHVDDVTGYRWYSGAQLDRARLVARLRLAGMPLARIQEVAGLSSRAAAAELTSYWRQVEADTASARALIADLVASLTDEEHDMTVPTTTTPTGRVHAAHRLGIGGREQQLDAVFLGEGAYAVADGFGGVVGLADEVAALLAGIDPAADPLRTLDATVAAAHALLTDRYADHSDAGCTLTAVVLRDDQAVLAHVGDSRAYLVREGRLERLTRDHSVVQTLVDEGRLTPAEAQVDERRVQLNRAIAVDAPFEPDLAVHVVRPGDRLVLTTDGVHARVEPAALAALLVAPTTPDDVARSVEDAVLAGEADDNYAVVVLDL